MAIKGDDIPQINHGSRRRSLGFNPPSTSSWDFFRPSQAWRCATESNTCFPCNNPPREKQHPTEMKATSSYQQINTVLFFGRVSYRYKILSSANSMGYMGNTKLKELHLAPATEHVEKVGRALQPHDRLAMAISHMTLQVFWARNEFTILIDQHHCDL